MTKVLCRPAANGMYRVSACVPSAGVQVKVLPRVITKLKQLLHPRDMETWETEFHIEENRRMTTFAIEINPHTTKCAEALALFESALSPFGVAGIDASEARV